MRESSLAISGGLPRRLTVHVMEIGDSDVDIIADVVRALIAGDDSVHLIAETDTSPRTEQRRYLIAS